MEARTTATAAVLLQLLLLLTVEQQLCSAAVLQSTSDVDPSPSPTDEEERQYEMERIVSRQRVTAGHRSYALGAMRSRSRASEAIESATLNNRRDLRCVVEGDIRVCDEWRDKTSVEQTGEQSTSPSRARSKRQVINVQYYSTWPNGTVLYAIDRDSYGTSADMAVSVIRKALDAWESKTSLRFVEITPPEGNADDAGGLNGGDSLDYLLIHNGSGCWSYVGRIGGRQELSLAKDGCLYKGVAMHELGHALGLIHEQSRPERDRYVLVLPNNIAGSQVFNFLKAPEPMVRHCTRYNVESVMHYGYSAFGIGARPTVVARTIDYVSLEGNRASATHYDYAAVCCLYGCQGDCTTECENDGYPVKDADTGACRCICPYGLGGPTCSDVDRAEFSCGSVVTLEADGSRPYRLDATSSRNSVGGKCAWLFKAPVGRVVKISFNTFNVAAQSGVCQHFVEVRQNLLGQTGTAQYCGSGVPNDVSSRGDFGINAALLIFDYSSSTAAAISAFSANVTAHADGCLGDPCRGAACTNVAGPTGYACVRRSDSFICGFENMASDNCSAIVLGSGAEGFTAAASNPAAAAQRPWEVIDAESQSVSSTQGRFMASAVALVPGTSRGLLRITPFDFRGESRCLKFQYFMESENAGILSVYRAVNGHLGEPVFSRHASAAAGHQYQKQQLDVVGHWLSSPPIEVKPPDSPADLVEIVFEAYHSGEDLSRSIIALDDIRYLAGKCPKGACADEPCGTAKCNEGAMTDEGMVTGIDYYTCSAADYPDSDASCSFEEWQDCSSLIDLEKMPGNSVAWQPRKLPGVGFKWPFSTGPSAAATGPSYLYAPLYTQAVGSKASLRLRPRKVTLDGWCLAFRFCMNGLNVGSLKAYRVVDGQYGSPRLLWAAYGHQGAQWLQAAVNVTMDGLTASMSFEMILEGVHGDVPNTTPGYYAADLAIDDVFLSKGTCDRFAGRFVSSALVAPTTTTTTTTTTASPCKWGYVWNAATRSWVRTCS